MRDSLQILGTRALPRNPVQREGLSSKNPFLEAPAGCGGQETKVISKTGTIFIKSSFCLFRKEKLPGQGAKFCPQYLRGGWRLRCLDPIL